MHRVFPSIMPTRRKRGVRARSAATLAAAVELAVAGSLAAPERAVACTLTTTGRTIINADTVFTLSLGATDTGDGLPTCHDALLNELLLGNHQCLDDALLGGGTRLRTRERSPGFSASTICSATPP